MTVDDPAPLLEARPDPDGAVDVIVIRGALDSGAVERYRSALRAFVPTGRPIVVDLSGLHFVDSSGLHLLLETCTVLQQTGQPVQYRGATRSTRRLLALCGVSEMFGLSP